MTDRLFIMSLTVFYVAVVGLLPDTGNADPLRDSSTEVTAGTAQLKSFHHPKFGFDITYPSYFEPADSSLAALLLKTKGQTYPTFNILRQNESYSLSVAVSEQVKRVEDSYRAVGLIDAQAKDGILRQSEHASYFETQVRFTQGDEDLSATVTIFPAGEHHYINTFIVPINSKLEVMDDVKVLNNSFSAPEFVQIQASPNESPSLGLLSIVLIFAIGLGIGAGLYRLNRRMS